MRLPNDISTKENKLEIEKVIRHITKIYKDSNKEITFTSGNSKQCRLVEIPCNTSIKSFSVYEKKTKWLTNLLKHVGAGGNDSGAYYISTYLAKYNITSFLCATKGIGVSIS